MQVTKASSPS